MSDAYKTMKVPPSSIHPSLSLSLSFFSLLLTALTLSVSLSFLSLLLTALTLHLSLSLFPLSLLLTALTLPVSLSPLYPSTNSVFLTQRQTPINQFVYYSIFTYFSFQRVVCLIHVFFILEFLHIFCKKDQITFSK